MRFLCYAFPPLFLPVRLKRKVFWPRLLKSVLPIAVLSAAGGWVYAYAAGMYMTDAQHTGDELKESLLWRLPFTMAAWGGGITFFCELFRHWWGKPNSAPAPVAAETKSAPVDAEQLLLQLLDQAEAAEQSRYELPVFAQSAPPA